MGKVTTILTFVAATALVFVAFAPLGGVLGEAAYDVYSSMIANGTPETQAALVPLLGIDAAFIILTLLVSYAGGVRLPSGLPHVFFALLVPFTLGAVQVRFFELAGDAGGLAGTFGTWNFVAMFLLSIAAAQLGVHFARWRFESRSR